MKPGVLWDQWEGEKMWGHVRVWICELCLRFGRVWNFGIWAADQEFASWGVRERGFGEWRMAVQGARGGVRGLFLSSLSRSLSPLPVLLAPSLFLSPSLSMCSAAPAVGLPTHSLSQGHTGRSLRDHFCTPTRLGRPQPAGGTHWSDGDWETEDSSVSFPVLL